MADDALSPGDFLRAMLRHKLVIAAGPALAAAAAAIACALIPPTYEAAATLEKVEKSGILESVRSIDDFRRLIADPASLERTITEARAGDLTPRALLASLSTRPSSRPNCMEVAARHPDPAVAAALANALARLGIESLGRERQAAYDVRKRVLEGRLGRLRGELIEAEAEFGKWLEESAVDVEALEIEDLHRTIRTLRERAALAEVRAEAVGGHVSDDARRSMDALRSQIHARGQELRRLTVAQNQRTFEKERRFARYRERRDAYAGQEKAYAEYLAEAGPGEPEMVVATEARAPAAPTRAPNASLIASAAIAGLAASAFVAMVLGSRAPHG